VPVVSLQKALAAAGVTGVHLAADGGVEHVYGDRVRPGAIEAGADAATLARVAAVARGSKGVAEVLARLPVPGVPSLAEVHPDWHVGHERIGDLIVVAAPGYQLVDPWDDVDVRFKGNHGSPGELDVPLVVSGGSPALRAAPAGTAAPSAVDVAPTIAALLGLRASRRVDGGSVPTALAGRPITAVLNPTAP
jgi:arylsulfatase A-like enzyme